MVQINPVTTPIAKFIWDEKYRYKHINGEPIDMHWLDTVNRVVRGVLGSSPETSTLRTETTNLILDGVLMPAGRIFAGAGTDKRVTLINCFVSPVIEDSMPGIMKALSVAAITQQMGGGIGMDFSTLRPAGAIVKGVGSVSTGPLRFMEMWDSMCQTIMSSGSRRGAMMATMRCDHPDIEAFIEAKRTKGKLQNFNLSVLVTDEFMEAVRLDKYWSLCSMIEPAAPSTIGGNTHKGWIYKTLPARELWDKILRATYDYAEPGVIFIDRVNAQNNLRYCEDIQCTNPCGEQPLPPNGDCNLGHINLAALVSNAFTPNAGFNYMGLEHAAGLMVRFLDAVIDVSKFPTEAQALEAQTKRRIGLGVTGLANCLAMLGLRYGSEQALDVTARIMSTIRDAAYSASIDLAQEKGPFPAFDHDAYLQAPFIKSLPAEIQKRIDLHGIRNGVLLSIAPTGTTSLLYNNVSSGIEPVFQFKYTRDIRQVDGSFKTFTVEDFGWALSEHITKTAPTGSVRVPPKSLYGPLVTVDDLTIEDHLQTLAVCQKYVDASISKTINVPESTTYEDFKEVYARAYALGCKSCTTYRPSPKGREIRGEILKKSPEPPKVTTVSIAPVARPYVLQGETYKLKWPTIESAFYLTINDLIDESGHRVPYECFINTKSPVHQEWISAATRMISAILRRGGEIGFIVAELEEINSPLGGQWVDGKMTPSIVALIGQTLREHFSNLGLLKRPQTPAPQIQGPLPPKTPSGSTCPKCLGPTLVHSEGCDKCLSCGYSSCG